MSNNFLFEFDLPPGLKKCQRCGEVKKITKFYLRKPTKHDMSTRRSWCRECESFSNRTSHTSKRRYMKNWKLQKKFGISIEEYDMFFQKQNGKCALCGRRPEDDSRKHSLAVDHDHATGKIRGLLCRHCNIGLGKLGDDLPSIYRVLDYLKQNTGFEVLPWPV